MKMSCYYRTSNDIPIEPAYKIENKAYTDLRIKIPKDITLSNTNEDDIREILELEIKREEIKLKS